MTVKVYQAGPINSVSDDGRGWRDRLKEQEWDGIEFVDPLDNYDATDDSRQYTWSDERIVREDKALIDECDAMLLHHEKVPSWGTPREHEYAVQTGTPVYVQTREANLSPWLTADAEVVEATPEAALEAIRQGFIGMEDELL